MRSWFPGITNLMRAGRDLSKVRALSCSWSLPVDVRSPQWIAKSAEGKVWE